MLTINRTRAFRDFQRSVGNCTAHINTAYVGTELIARGMKKPDDLRIKWQAPCDPRNFVEQTRNLLHAAMLGHVFIAVDIYLRDLAHDPWIELSDEKRKILQKAVKKSKGVAYSITERFAELDMQLDEKMKFDFLLVEVLVAWRNRIVHKKSTMQVAKETSAHDLTHSKKRELQSLNNQFSQIYGNLSIQNLLDHFDQIRSPTRKDLVALTSASQNFIRALDIKLIQRSFPSERQLVHIAKQEIYRRLSSTDHKAFEKLWGKDNDARGRRFRAILEEAGFTSKIEVLSFSLPQDFISSIASLSGPEDAKSYLCKNDLSEFLSGSYY